MALASSDALAYIVAGALASIGSGAMQQTTLFEDWQIDAILFAIFTHFIFARLFGIYRTRSILNKSRALQRLPIAAGATFALLLLIAVATKSAQSYSRFWFFAWASSSICLLMTIRWAFFRHIADSLNAGAFVNRALTVGVFCKAMPAAEIETHTRGETRVVATQEISNISDVVSLAKWIAQDEIEQIYLATPWEDIPLVLDKLHLLRHLSTRVYVLPNSRFPNSLAPRVSIIGGRPSFCAIEEPIFGWNLWIKRAEDIVVASAGLLLLSPLFAIVAALIKLESPGPVFFRQIRTGFNGRTFALWKFRSMYAHMTDYDASRQTSRDDPRVTKVGRVIRRTSIDELPQLINVVQGAMSLVGPRPHALATKAEGKNLEDLVDYYAVRHRVKPGMTGWAQIHGFRGELDSIEKLQKRVDYDIEYIDKWSLLARHRNHREDDPSDLQRQEGLLKRARRNPALAMARANSAKN